MGRIAKAMQRHPRACIQNQMAAHFVRRSNCPKTIQMPRIGRQIRRAPTEATDQVASLIQRRHEWAGRISLPDVRRNRSADQL